MTASPSPVCGKMTAQTISNASNPAQTASRFAASLATRASRPISCGTAITDGLAACSIDMGVEQYRMGLQISQNVAWASRPCERYPLGKKPFHG